jgi:hypothetical protein
MEISYVRQFLLRQFLLRSKNWGTKEISLSSVAHPCSSLCRSQNFSNRCCATPFTLLLRATSRTFISLKLALNVLGLQIPSSY